jgi:hypothetical protein
MTTLPDGLYDLLVDERIRDLAQQLRNAGQADVVPLTGAARRRRLTEVLARLLPELLAEAHFETLWNDPEFQRFDPQDDQHRLELRRALKQAKGTSTSKRRAEKRSAFRRVHALRIMTPCLTTAVTASRVELTSSPLISLSVEADCLSRTSTRCAMP